MFGHNIMPPSHFQGNEFTAAFQEIVNTYGIPTYKEVNPAVFACVSFPFLFGVMFGDVGHGSLLLLFGLALTLGKEKFKGTPLEMMLFGRYMFLLMGFFAVFNGLCYNEFFALPMQGAESCWMRDPADVTDTPAELEAKEHYLVPKPDCVYPIGVDYAWGPASNKLAFTNVMKMKISVILAIVQMSIGICVKACNALYKKDRIEFFFEFIPMITLLLVLFGWMDVLIIVKWLTDWPARGGRPEAPSIIPTMINNFLNLGEQKMYIFEDGSTQKAISIAFLVIAFITVPIMLCVKPCYIGNQHKKHDQEQMNPSISNEENEALI